MSGPVVLRLEVDTKTGEASVKRLGTTIDNTMNRVGGAVDKSAKRQAAAMDRMHRRAQTLTKTLRRLATLGIAGFTAALGASIKIGAQFELSAQQVANIAGAAGDGMAQLSEKARELGRTTAFTAAQVMMGMQSLASMGMKTDEISESIEHAIKLSGMFGAEVSVASEMIAVSMKMLGTETSGIQDLTDQFAVTVQNSLFPSLENLSSAYMTAAQAGSAFSYSTEQVLRGLVLFRNAGIRARKAGMYYKMSLQQLVAETPKLSRALEKIGLTHDEVNPMMNDAVDIFKRLAESNFDAETAIEMFQKTYGTAVLSIINSIRTGTAGLEALDESMLNRHETVKKGYERMMDTIDGWWKQLKSTFEEMAIAIFTTYQPMLKDALQDLTQRAMAFAERMKDPEVQAKIREFFTNVFDAIQTVIDALIDLAKFGIRAADAIAKFVDHVGLMNLALGYGAIKIAGFVRDSIILISHLKAAGAAAKAAALNFAAFWAAVVGPATIMAAASAGFVALTLESNRLARSIKAANKRAAEFSITIAEQRKKMALLKEIYGEAGSEAWETWANTKSILDSSREAIEGMGLDFKQVAEEIMYAGGTMEAAENVLERMVGHTDDIRVSLDGITFEKFLALEDVVQLSNDWEAVLEKVGISADTLWKKFEKSNQTMSDLEGIIKEVVGQEYDINITFDPNRIKKLQLEITKAVGDGGKAGADIFSEKIVEKARKNVAPGLAAAMYESAAKGDYIGYMALLKNQMYEYIKAAVIQSFIDGLLQRQVIEPLIAILDGIEWHLESSIESGLTKFDLALEASSQIMSQWYPFIERVVHATERYAPAIEQVVDDTRALANSAISQRSAFDGLGAKIYSNRDSMGRLREAFDGLRDKSGELGSSFSRAATTLEQSSGRYKQGSQYSSYTTTTNIRDWDAPGRWDFFEVGISSVPKSGLAFLHKGEKIVPKAHAQKGGPQQNVVINITALDPVGMQKVVEDEIRPRLAEINRRTWG